MPLDTEADKEFSKKYPEISKALGLKVAAEKKPTAAFFDEYGNQRDPWFVETGTIGFVSDGESCIGAVVARDEKWGTYLWAIYPEIENESLLNLCLNKGGKELITLMLPDEFYKGDVKWPEDALDQDYTKIIESIYGDDGDEIEDETDPLDDIKDSMMDSMEKNWSDALSEGIDDDRQTVICTEVMEAIHEAEKANWRGTWMKFNDEKEATFAQSLWPVTVIPAEDKTKVKFVIPKEVTGKKPHKYRDDAWRHTADQESRDSWVLSQQKKDSGVQKYTRTGWGMDDCEYSAYVPKPALPPILTLEGEVALDSVTFFKEFA